MITGLPNQYVDLINQNDNLKRYLLSLTQAVPPTKRSWLYETKEPQTVLDDWMNHLTKLETGDSFSQEVFQFDTSQIEKWGPQGGHAPVSKLMDEVISPTFQDDSPHPSEFKLSPETRRVSSRYAERQNLTAHLELFSRCQATRDWSNAIDQCVHEMHQYQVSSVRPASYRSVVDDMKARDTLESNSGWPDFKRRSLPEVKSHAIADAVSGLYEQYPAIALFRTYRQKTRLVWMFPMATNIVEGSLYQPLQSALINANIPFYAPWVGFDRVRRMISDAYDSGKFIYASDFSNTDAHFKLAASAQAGLMFGHLLDEGSQVDLGRSLEHMHKIPLIISPDQWITGAHGVSSGSNWTNFIETGFDRIFSFYVTKYTRVDGFYAIGDDMAWKTDKFDEKFKAELEELGKNVGQVIKADKTTVYPDKVKSLQRLFQRGYRRPDGLTRGVYSTIRALNSSLFPERFHDPRHWSSDMFCARQFMILENCVDHPLFEDFVKFVVLGQKDLIPFAKKSKGDLDKITRQSKLIRGLNPTYNQERRDSSLSDFESISIARNL